MPLSLPEGILFVFFGLSNTFSHLYFLYKAGAKGINDAKTPLYKLETSINQYFLLSLQVFVFFLIHFNLKFYTREGLENETKPCKETC